MPLFRALGEHGSGAKAHPGQKRTSTVKFKRRSRKTDEDGSVLSLERLCMLSLADNMKEVWVKDYSEKYLDEYCFRHIMGPFNLLSGELVEELTQLLCRRKQLSRAALHLLLVPQLRGLSLAKCPGLVNSALCPHIAARCQGLWSLDLSGAQQLPSKVLAETLCSLPYLRSLSLAGTPCDRSVIRTIAQRCRLLRHLDVSHCHFLSPAALLLLGSGASISSSECSSGAFSPSQSCCPPYPSPSPLSSLLALDIGFGEHEEDPVAAAAYLLLSLPCLERVALERLAQACCLIQNREFDQMDQFTEREGVPRLAVLFQERRQMLGMESCRKTREGAAANEEDEDEERILWEGCGSERKADSSGDEGPSLSQNQAEEHRRARAESQSDDKHFMLHLKHIECLSCDSLDSLSRLCPNICSISVNTDDYDEARGRSQGSLLTAGLKTWSGQLRSLCIRYPGPLVELLPALQVAGWSLFSLTLEGLKTSPHSPLLEVIKSCPKLRDLSISAEPPTTPQEEENEEDQLDDQNLPWLPDLSSLTLKFSYEHSQMRPSMSWWSLRQVLKCLLTGSPLLEKLSLVSLPCPLDSVLQYALHRGGFLPRRFPYYSDLPLMPLRRLQHIELPRTDVRTGTVERIMLHSKRLKYIDVSYCWEISQQGWWGLKFNKAEVVWS